MDFVSGFTLSIKERYTACCVVCDGFTRMIHLDPWCDHATSKDAVGMMIRIVIARHGYLRVIIAGRETRFDSEL